jgi:HD-GYP domain-containing protein (c-di-GMP phosphodiesterase class II)
MSDSRVLLNKITELRHRLAQAQGIVGEATRAAATLIPPPEGEPDQPIDAKLDDGNRRQTLLDAALRQISGPLPGADTIRPTQLTHRAKRLLERGRELIVRMREIAGDPLLSQGDAATETAEVGDPLLTHYRDTAAMTDVALRMVQAFPDAASEQLRLCEGLENILANISERLGSLETAMRHRRRELASRNHLASLLTQLFDGATLDLRPFVELTGALLEESMQTNALRFPHAVSREPAEWVAAHGLTTARIAIRIARHLPEWSGKLPDVAVASMIHDVGMIGVPIEILNSDQPLTDDDRRTVEGHARAGAELVSLRFPAIGSLTDAILSHHERLDGTGYPSGLRDGQVSSLARLIAVADVYAAMVCPRSHRPAFDPRSALTDTLMMAENGLLDRNYAEQLMRLSFYPVGSVVEMNDGAVGVVVATNMGRRDLDTPSRPVVAMLTDPTGHLLPIPVHLDLSNADGHAIIRTLTSPERQHLLGRRYPELV